MKFLQASDAMKLSGISRSNFYKTVDADTFPRGIWIGKRRYWPEYAIYRWLSAAADGLSGAALSVRCREIDEEVKQLLNEAAGKAKAEFQKQAAGHDLSYLNGEV